MIDIPPTPNPVSITERAANKVLEALDEEGMYSDTHGLRVAIVGGGCAGLEYFLDFHDLSQENDYDFVCEYNGIKIIIDQFSATHLMGTEIDYVDTLQNSGFKFNNPNITRTCGCGSSVGY